MTFDWNNYLVLAKKLATDKADDAALRTAVSRSYYCIFNLAMTKAKGNQYTSKDDASSHDQLWSLYGRNTDKDCEQISLIGARMKRRRVKADYRAFFDNLKDEVEDAIEDAEECLKLLDQMSKDLPKDLPRSWSF